MTATNTGSRPLDVYGAGLAGTPAGGLALEYTDGVRRQLPVGIWTSQRSAGDETLVLRCNGPTLDIGCGPGRLLVALGERGIPALGVDIAPVAVRLARARGGLALSRSVFQALPGTGRWTTVLLADGNVGIGGDPVGLMRRLRELLTVGGRVLVEVDPDPSRSGPVTVRLVLADRTSDWFRWAHVGPADVAALAEGADLHLDEQWEAAGRWFVALRRT